MDFLSTIIYHLLRRKAFKFPIINNIQKILGGSEGIGGMKMVSDMATKNH